MASENPQPGQQPQPRESNETNEVPADEMAMGGRVLFIDVGAAFEYLGQSVTRVPGPPPAGRFTSKF